MKHMQLPLSKSSAPKGSMIMAVVIMDNLCQTEGVLGTVQQDCWKLGLVPPIYKGDTRLRDMELSLVHDHLGAVQSLEASPTDSTSSTVVLTELGEAEVLLGAVSHSSLWLLRDWESSPCVEVKGPSCRLASGGAPSFGDAVFCNGNA